jgi:hypothetical protein
MIIYFLVALSKTPCSQRSCGFAKAGFQAFATSHKFESNLLLYNELMPAFAKPLVG